MLILNLKDVKKRYTIDLIQTFKVNFPDLNYFIESANNLKNLPSSIAILLQRTESYVFLRIGCKSIHDKLNHIPFLTVHDSVLVEERFGDDVKSILENTIENHTKIPVGVVIKKSGDPMNNIDVMAQEIWKKLMTEVKKIKNKKTSDLKTYKNLSDENKIIEKITRMNMMSK